MILLTIERIGFGLLALLALLTFAADFHRLYRGKPLRALWWRFAVQLLSAAAFAYIVATRAG